MQTIEWLKKECNLRVIDEPLDVELEIPHVAYIEVKKSHSSPLLFTRPISRKKGIEYDMPVLMNLYASKEVTQKILEKAPDEIAKEIGFLLKPEMPKGLWEKIKMLPQVLKMASIFPKRLSVRGLCQHHIYKDSQVDLESLPILTTWPDDGGAFITMGQVYTQSLDGKINNLGMYRLQRYSSNELGLHWQVHKDAASIFEEYKKAGKKMPVSVAIGGDPLYIWCGQAPMPHGVFELLLYGFIRKKRAKLVKSITNEIYVPQDVDIVIEGFVDPQKSAIEGPFGDHTGYYTPKESFPVLEVSAITTKKEPTYTATVVGKPPLEDKYMGWATERIFLPMLKPISPELIDYHMPENGVFHNLILAKMKVGYKGHALQFMHAFWGVGQMSFVKHAIFVDEDAPLLTDYEALTEYILNRIEPKKILSSRGVIDHLDHASKEQFVGGKLGVDATGEEIQAAVEQPISDSELLKKLKEISDMVVDVRQYFTQTKNPIALIALNKVAATQPLLLAIQTLYKHLKIALLVDRENNCLDNSYMMLWRVVNNIDVQSDLVVKEVIALDATKKGPADSYDRYWPDETLCDPEVIRGLMAKGVIDVNASFLKQYGIVDFEQINNSLIESKSKKTLKDK